MSDDSVLEDLQQWKARRSGGLAGAHYLFSPADDEKSQRDWAEYQLLENRRIASGAARLPWQTTTEQWREYEPKIRQKFYSPMKPHLWKLCPLWVHMHRYLGRPELDVQWRLYSWDRLLPEWEEFDGLYHDARFRSTLSPVQESSYSVLKAWWSSAYCDTELLNAARSYLKSKVGTRCTLNPTDVGKLEENTPAGTASSLYHSFCFRLFLAEFHPRSWEPYQSTSIINTLQRFRFRAGCEAVTQKLAFAVLHPNSLLPSQHRDYPHVIMSGDTPSATWEDVQKPYYLWDVSSQKTVIVHELASCPAYTCISHTWGRWRTNSDIFVPGVPWLVPENTLYDVQDLPRQLMQLGFAFIWLDLFCIPQDGSDRAEKEIANQSAIFKGSQNCIAWINDADSWDNLQGALDWLSLKFLKTTSRVDDDDIDEKLAMASDAASGSTGLMRLGPGLEITDDYVGEPSFWFSSLWTLQECVLCPHIQLYTKSWKRLDDRQGNAIPLQSLLVFLRETYDITWRDGPVQTSTANPEEFRRAMAVPRKRGIRGDGEAKVPVGVDQIMAFFVITRLGNVLTSGLQTTVLTNANIRQCTGNRAPAIMSALGVTDWYKAAIASRKRFHDLVLGIYPVEFLNEAAQKFGAIFYENSSSKGHVGLGMETVFAKEDLVGTLLPFSRAQGWSCGGPRGYELQSIDMQDHSAVSSWKIYQDGTVKVPFAGVAISSEERLLSRKIDGYLSWAVIISTTPKEIGRGMSCHTNDMQKKLCELAGDSPIFAVALYEECHYQHGILLQKLPYAIHGMDYLVKVGNYFTDELMMPPSRETNWVVL